MKFNVKEIKERIKKDREWFIAYWAEYILSHSDREWSHQQKVLIDSQISGSRSFYKHNPDVYDTVSKDWNNKYDERWNKY